MGLYTDMLLIQQRGGPINKYWPGDKVVIMRNVTGKPYDFLVGDRGTVKSVVPPRAEYPEWWDKNPDEHWAYRISLDHGCMQVWSFESELELQGV